MLDLKSIHMEKSLAKSSGLKFAKSASQSSASWSSSERGMTKDEARKERLSDKSKNSQRLYAKENTKPEEIKLRTQQRALKRAMFNYEVATKLYIIQQQKKQEQRIQKLIEEEEVKLLRKEMIPRAQLMPFFDRPFFPQRSSRPLTIPREPSLGVAKRCVIPGDSLYSFQQGRQALNAGIYK